MPRTDNFCHLMMAALVICAAPAAASAHPLEDAAYEAMVLCLKVDATSLDECSTVGGKSPEKSAARKAVLKMLNLRAAFMRSCNDSREMGSCIDQADWLMGSGLSRLNDPVQYVDHPPPAAQRR